MEETLTPAAEHLVERMRVLVYNQRSEMGAAAAGAVGQRIRDLQGKSQAPVRIVFAAAPSQNELYEGLVREQGIDWSRVHAFHMDEYTGLPEDAPPALQELLAGTVVQQSQSRTDRAAGPDGQY